MNSKLSSSGYESPLLEFDNITIIRGDHIVLDSLSLIVYEGENVTILGPNGSGKSTLIKSITRELYPVMTENFQKFKVWGSDQWNVFDLRSHFGVVSNDLQNMFARNITGMDVLLSGFFSSIGLFNQVVTPEMKKRAMEIASFLEITHLLDRSMIEISSGESRRLLIGRALVHNPKVLILDEPTTNLDLHALHTLRGYLRKIAQTGIGIIMVTHQLHDIIPEITRVILMHNGRIVNDGLKGEILTDRYISELFSTPVKIREEEGYYYATGY